MADVQLGALAPAAAAAAAVAQWAADAHGTCDEFPSQISIHILLVLVYMTIFII